MENQGVSKRGTRLALSLRVHEKSKAALLLCQTTHESTNEYQLNRQPVQGYKVFLPLILTRSTINISMLVLLYICIYKHSSETPVYTR